ncbi:twin-arginine translocase subunit TatC [Candidatus Enterovibrio escicola]|uniref:Sec-independent protein translocase protein TatC n=1 Tax=Candidatus Enterovibrio escicola TaxID=1927127 RepID=A0A2A5SYY0_9GAMM|nr:twin-arginine translocase subunit TatC [Candidatus Enterovibrio escacola]PCS21117.1 Twin-arginine translocation protein TatC [Candidatus Enterovibrio escacola]
MPSVKNTQPLINHLAEVRDRLLRVLVAIFFVFICLVYFSNDIYTFIAAPLVARLPEGTSMIATDVASPFFTPIKLTLVISVLIVVPVVLYQLWAFIAPGLYKHEKRLVIPLLISSSLLFYFGVSFAYFVVFPLVFYFFTSIAPVDVKIATDIASYLDFILSLFMAFGIAFEIPVCIILLVWRGLVTPDDLKIKRPYIVVVAFVVGMLLTPPDLFSQMLLAIPMCLLFEVGLFFSRFYKPCEKYDQK